MKTKILNAGKLGMVALFLGGPLPAQENQIYRSGTGRVALLELFTSEGCSSCPPADAWLGRLREDKDLWTGFVPVAFHVDYWDGLGWKDPFAKKAFTERQRVLAAGWNKGSVYTPNLVWNGQDWPNWARAGGLPESDGSLAGILEAEYGEGTVAIRFHAARNWGGGFARVALLGSDLQSEVRRGENSGRRLSHDFVALDYAGGRLLQNQEGVWEVRISLQPGEGPRRALAVWVESGEQPRPIQATGGWIVPKPKS